MLIWYLAFQGDRSPRGGNKAGERSRVLGLRQLEGGQEYDLGFEYPRKSSSHVTKKLSEQANSKKGAALNANYLSFEDQRAAKCAQLLLMLSLQEDFMDWWSYLTNSTTTLKYCQYLTWPFIWSLVMLFHGLFVMPLSLGKTLSPSCPWLSKNWCQILTLLFRNKGLGNIVD